jgi:hypothetical protein
MRRLSYGVSSLCRANFSCGLTSVPRRPMAAVGRLKRGRGLYRATTATDQQQQAQGQQRRHTGLRDGQGRARSRFGRALLILLRSVTAALSAMTRPSILALVFK